MSDIEVTGVNYGHQSWKKVGGIFYVLAFGSFPHQRSPGLIHDWISVDASKVPDEVKKALR